MDWADLLSRASGGGMGSATAAVDEEDPYEAELEASSNPSLF